MKIRRNEWVMLFLEYLLGALADGLVALVGWIGVRVYKRWRKRKKRRDDE